MIAVVASGQWAGQVQPYVDIMQFYAKLNFVKLMGGSVGADFGKCLKVQGEEEKLQPHFQPALNSNSSNARQTSFRQKILS